MMTKTDCINNDCMFYHQTFAGPMCSATALYLPKDCVCYQGEPAPKAEPPTPENMNKMSSGERQMVTFALIGSMFAKQFGIREKKK